MNASTYRKEVVIDGANSDFLGNMTCAGMLRAAQLIAAEHCADAGYGDDYMASVERVWILTKIKITIPRCPRMGERIAIETAAYAPDRILYPRVTRFLSTDGEERARIESVWVLVDTKTNRIARKAPDGMNFPFAAAIENYDFAPPPRRECPVSETVRVRYSMVDVNRHLNNAVYADIVENALEARLFSGEVVKELMIAYHREAKPGAEIALGVAEEGDGAYVSGTVEGAACFEAAVVFEAG